MTCSSKPRPHVSSMALLIIIGISYFTQGQNNFAILSTIRKMLKLRSNALSMYIANLYHSICCTGVATTRPIGFIGTRSTRLCNYTPAFTHSKAVGNK